MRVYPVDFIDNKWYEMKDKQVEDLNKMYDGVKGYLGDLEEKLGNIDNKIQSLASSITETKGEQLSHKEEFNDSIVGIEKSISDIKLCIEKQKEMFEEFIKSHEALHNENHSYLDGLFGLFRRK